MNNKVIWGLVFIVGLIVSIFLYRSMGEEMRATIIFFGALILVCLIAGLLVVSGIKYFLKSH